MSGRLPGAKEIQAPAPKTGVVVGVVHMLYRFVSSAEDVDVKDDASLAFSRLWAVSD